MGLIFWKEGLFFGNESSVAHFSFTLLSVLWWLEQVMDGHLLTSSQRFSSSSTDLVDCSSFILWFTGQDAQHLWRPINCDKCSMSTILLYSKVKERLAHFVTTLSVTKVLVFIYCLTHEDVASCWADLALIWLTAGHFRFWFTWQDAQQPVGTNN